MPAQRGHCDVIDEASEPRALSKSLEPCPTIQARRYSGACSEQKLQQTLRGHGQQRIRLLVCSHVGADLPANPTSGTGWVAFTCWIHRPHTPGDCLGRSPTSDPMPKGLRKIGPEAASRLACTVPCCPDRCPCRPHSGHHLPMVERAWRPQESLMPQQAHGRLVMLGCGQVRVHHEAQRSTRLLGRALAAAEQVADGAAVAASGYVLR